MCQIFGILGKVLIFQFYTVDEPAELEEMASSDMTIKPVNSLKGV